MWLGYRISFGLLGLAALSGVLACSGQESPFNANGGGSASRSAGTPGVAGTAGATGLAGGTSVGSAGSASSASSAGVVAQGGFAANAGTGGTISTGLPSGGQGGYSGSAEAGSAGGAGSGASAGSAGFGNFAGAGGGSAAFAKVSSILGKNCGIKGCHADKQSPHFAPDAMLYATLTGPNTVLAECDYTRLVEEGDPSRSALVRLMNRECGSFTMPPTCNKTTCLSAADLQALSDWISAGAPP